MSEASHVALRQSASEALSLAGAAPICSGQGISHRFTLAKRYLTGCYPQAYARKPSHSRPDRRF
jgi:hypothetical protein